MANQYTTGCAIKVDPMVRFMEKVQVQSNGCWMWTGCTSKTDGYGRFSFECKNVWAHSFIYLMIRGPIPEGYERMRGDVILVEKLPPEAKEWLVNHYETMKSKAEAMLKLLEES